MATKKIHKQMVECMSRTPLILLTRMEDAPSNTFDINQRLRGAKSENAWSRTSRRYSLRNRKSKSLCRKVGYGELTDDKGPNDSDGNDSNDSESQIKSENNEHDVEECELLSPLAPPKKRASRRSKSAPEKSQLEEPKTNSRKSKPKPKRVYTPACRATKKERTCNSCGEAFMSLKQLRIHATTKHGIEKPFICGTCQEPFSNAHLFLAHKNDVHDFIRKTTTKEVRLQRRSAKIDWTPADFICHYCGKKWNSARELKQHIVEVHRRIVSSTTCELCGVKCKTIESLRLHFQTIHLGFKFSGSARKMQDKLKETQGELPVAELKVQNFVTCELCGKIFWSQWRLDEHMSRPHKVANEGKEERERSKVQTKPHACHECGLFYPSRTALIQHFNSKKHRSDKTLMCDKCGKTFRKPDGLRKHIAREHPEIPLPRRFEYGPTAYEDPNSRKMNQSVFDDLFEEPSFFEELTQVSTAEAEFPQGQVQNYPLALPGVSFLVAQGQTQPPPDRIVASGLVVPVPQVQDQPPIKTLAVSVPVAQDQYQPQSHPAAVSQSLDQPQNDPPAESRVPVPVAQGEHQPRSDHDPPAVSGVPDLMAHQEFNISLAPLSVPMSDPIAEIHSFKSLYEDEVDEEAPNFGQLEPFEEGDVKMRPSLTAFESTAEEEQFEDYYQPIPSPASGRSDDDRDFDMQVDKERLQRLRRACTRRSRKESNDDSPPGPVDIKIEHGDDSQWEDLQDLLQEDFYAEDATEIPRQTRSKGKAKISRLKPGSPRQEKERIACRLSGCRFRAQDHDQLAKHRAAVHGRSDVSNYNFRCDQCDFKATKSEWLQLHQRIHTQGHSIRLKSLDSKSLSPGKNGPTSGVKILCRLSGCRFLAVDQAELAQHRSDVHGRTDPARSYDFKCDKCDFKATKPKSLEIHQRTHTRYERLRYDSKSKYRSPGTKVQESGVKILCRLDGCRFRAVGHAQLARHRSDVHGRTGPARSYDFKCDQCNFKAITSESLLLHQRIHTPGHVKKQRPRRRRTGVIRTQRKKKNRKPETKILCRLTGCRFRAVDVQELVQHRLDIHRRNDPIRSYNFKCDDCRFKARSAVSLELHQLKHVLKARGTPKSSRIPGKVYRKPEEFVCRLDGCRYRPKDFKNLARHRKNVHGRADNQVRLYQFKCMEPFCTFRARYAESYESHLLTHKLDIADASAGVSDDPGAGAGVSAEGAGVSAEGAGVSAEGAGASAGGVGVSAGAGVSAGGAGTQTGSKLTKSRYTPAYPCTHPGCSVRLHSRVRLISHIHRIHRNTPTAARMPHLPPRPSRLTGLLESGAEVSSAIPLDKYKKPRKCGLHGCEFVATTRSELKAHLLTLHGSAWARIIRKRRVTPNVPWKYCEIDSCTFKALMPESIANHQRTVHDKLVPVTRYTCPHCDKAFSTNVYRQTHINLKHTGGTAPRVPCHHCTRDFSCRIALFGHIQRDHPDKPTFPCGICTKIFYHEDERTLHEEKHMKFSGGQTRFKCVVQNCTEVCTNQQSLIDHVKSMHDVRVDRKTICPTCGKEYLASTYSAHARTHMERPRRVPKHKCGSCPKIFWKPTELESHLEAAHPELFEGQEKTFICDTCGISFHLRGAFHYHRYHFHLKKPRKSRATTTVTGTVKNDKPRSRKSRARKSTVGMVSAGTVGDGNVSSGTLGTGTAGTGTLSTGTAGAGTLGTGTAGAGTLGTGTAGAGTLGTGTVHEDGIVKKPKRKRRTKAEMLREREDSVNGNGFCVRDAERDPRPSAPNPKARRIIPIAHAQEQELSPQSIMPHPPPAFQNQPKFQQYYHHTLSSQLLPYFDQNSEMGYSSQPPPPPPHYFYHP